MAVLHILAGAQSPGDWRLEVCECDHVQRWRLRGRFLKADPEAPQGQNTRTSQQVAAASGSPHSMPRSMQ